MKPILLYLSEVIAISGILYGYYHFFLRNNRFHGYNRYFLLAATIVSICIPFARVDIYFNSGENIPAFYKVLDAVRVGTGNAAQSGFWSWQIILQIIYCVITAILFTRIFLTIRKLHITRKKYKAEQINDILLIYTNEQNSPFSFFKWLFWNNDINPQSESGQKIMKHEMYHIQQKHSLDTVFLELLSALFWFNPFLLRIKKEVKAIHEFSADQYAIGASNNYEYAELLLQQAFQTRQKLVNPFFHNQIKRRIAMITNSSKASFQYLRKTMILPVALFVTVLVIADCKAKDPFQDMEQRSNSKDITKTQRVETAGALKKVEIEASFPDGEEGWRKFLQGNINANVPVDNGATEGQYTCWVEFIVDEKGNISDIRPLTNIGYGMDQEVVRIMKLSPKWIAANDHGVAVRSYRKQPVTFVVQAE